MELEQKIESILFYLSDPVSYSYLSKILGQKESVIKESVEKLKLSLNNRGLKVIQNDKMVSLITSPEISPLIKSLEKEKLSSELSKATLETLSIILYHDNATEENISFIRGVNSNYILKNLKIRGLIEDKVGRFLPSIKLLSFLGLESREEIKNFSETKNALDKILNHSISDS